MRHLQQPPQSKVCGQTCVAMVAGVSLDQAIEACTVGKRRPSSEHDLRRGLRRFGLELQPFTRGDVVDVTRPALVRVRYDWRAHGYHWIAMLGAWVYDPSCDAAIEPGAYHRFMRRHRGHITSWAPVWPAA